MRRSALSPERRRRAGVLAGRTAGGLFAGLIALACAPPPVPPSSSLQPPRIVLISIDTCRADHLSLYGYERETTPQLEELARDGIVFDNAFTQATGTTPSHASLMTSLYPSRHGAANAVPLREEHTTLAEILAQAGYRTAAFVSGWTMTARDSGLAQGFEVYDDRLSRAGMPEFSSKPTERPAAETTDRALSWLAEHAGEPFFLFVHYFDPHGQYNPPAPYDTMFPPTELGRHTLDPERIPTYALIEGETDAAVYESRYDGEIRYVDDQIARLIGQLESLGLRDDTLLVVSSDHGESLTEHDSIFSHGSELYDPTTHVPLLISSPGLPRGRRVGEIVELIDVLPTLLELAGLEPSEALDGTSLLPLVRGAPNLRSAYAVSETTNRLTLGQAGRQGGSREKVALRTADWKYIKRLDTGWNQLFNLEVDPGELRDLASTDPVRAEAMGAFLARLLEAAPEDSDPAATLDEEERARLEEGLRALGYLE